MRINFILLLTIVFMHACTSSSERMPMGRLNHPLMDLRQSPTFPKQQALTNLASFEKSAGGGGCATCAK